MLTKQEFELLKKVKLIESINDIFNRLSDCDCFDTLVKQGYIENFQLTKRGEAELSNYKVKNAVILAAGGAEMSPKLIYSYPKGLFKMNGEPIIERQIKQLQKVGIKDIYVVVGYKKEMYFYLEEKYNITILVNNNPKKNNILSLYSAIDVLDNTYICNCDNYFSENPFEAYVYDSFHATVEKDDLSNEIAVITNLDKRIIGTRMGKGMGECFYGHAYFSKCFSQKMRKFLLEEITDFKIDTLFWEEFYAKHIPDLDMFARKYKIDFIAEFDSIQEVQTIDEMFIENISEELTDKICAVFNCTKNNIANIEIVDKGFSNIIFRFSIFDENYVLRYPGESASKVNDRKKEVIAQKIVAGLGIDNTYLYIDESGCKISKWIDNCIDLSNTYYKDHNFMVKLVEKLKVLHRYQVNKENQQILLFNPMAEADRLMSYACKMKGDLFAKFENIRRDVYKLFDYLEKDRVDKSLCHNDINANNVLLNDRDFELIDWEFAGYCDPGFDFGRVIDAYDFASPEIDRLLEIYLGYVPAIENRRHFIGYIAIHSWYYFCWALYKESINEDTAYWMVYFYHRIKLVLRYVLPLYECS
jgi:CTP:phosphocholine cytidylyltransferase-like protein/thiamine kinase-like enzyme